MEQITLLSYIAGQTSKIRLVTSVLIVPHRNPLIAAKSLATLDLLSGGRLVVGVGVGWMREEFQALGLPPFEERGAVTDEYIRAFKVLWTEDDPHFQGKYISFDDISFLPKPVQKPHPPIWVGGESRPALRRTAELADGWYPLGSNPTFPMGTPEQLKAGMERLAGYAERFGRDPSTIETIYRTHQFELLKQAAGPDRLPFVGDADQIAGDIRQYQDMGVTSMIWDFLRQTDDLDSMLGLMEDFSTQVWPKV
jgi:probable F420-dependent oxidoreductase